VPEYRPSELILATAVVLVRFVLVVPWKDTIAASVAEMI
jgi:hypothetical protein